MEHLKKSVLFLIMLLILPIASYAVTVTAANETSQADILIAIILGILLLFILISIISLSIYYTNDNC